MADWWFFSTRDSKKTNSHSSSCSFKPIEAHHLFSTFVSSAPPYTPLKLNNALSFFLSFLFFFFFLNRSDNWMKPQALNVSLSLFLSILVIACKRTFECRVLLFLFFSRMCLVCFIPPSGRLNLFRLDTFGKWVQSTMSIKKRSKFRTRLVLGILSLPDREAFFQVGWFHNHRWNSLSLSLWNQKQSPMAHFEASLLLARCAWGGERLPGRMTTRGEQLQCEWEEVNFWCAVEDGAEKGDGVPLSGCIRAARTMRYFYYILRRSNLWIFLSVPFSIYSLIDPLSLILLLFFRGYARSDLKNCRSSSYHTTRMTSPLWCLCRQKVLLCRPSTSNARTVIPSGSLYLLAASVLAVERSLSRLLFLLRV